jgi:hypothetical protein
MWLGKSPGEHVAGASKWLGKQISAGTRFVGRLHQHVGDIKDRYQLMKKQGLDYLTNAYSPALADLAKQGIGYLEGEASSATQAAAPMLALGSAVGNAFANYGA